MNISTKSPRQEATDLLSLAAAQANLAAERLRYDAGSPDTVAAINAASELLARAKEAFSRFLKSTPSYIQAAQENQRAQSGGEWIDGDRVSFRPPFNQPRNRAS